MTNPFKNNHTTTVIGDFLNIFELCLFQHAYPDIEFSRYQNNRMYPFQPIVNTRIILQKDDELMHRIRSAYPDTHSFFDMMLKLQCSDEVYNDIMMNYKYIPDKRQTIKLINTIDQKPRESHPDCDYNVVYNFLLKKMYRSYLLDELMCTHPDVIYKLLCGIKHVLYRHQNNLSVIIDALVDYYTDFGIYIKFITLIANHLSGSDNINLNYSVALLIDYIPDRLWNTEPMRKMFIVMNRIIMFIICAKCKCECKYPRFIRRVEQYFPSELLPFEPLFVDDGSLSREETIVMYGEFIKLDSISYIDTCIANVTLCDILGEELFKECKRQNEEMPVPWT